jgi:hypothetical protein
MKKNASTESKEITLEQIPGGIKIRKGSKSYTVSGVPNGFGEVKFFIDGQVPSKKNSKGVMISKSTGKPVLVLSKQYQQYEKNTASRFNSILPYFLMACSVHTKPYNIKLTFARQKDQLFDYFGPGETIADLMVKHGLLDDDNVREVKFFFGDYYVDAEKPGVIIEFLPDGTTI